MRAREPANKMLAKREITMTKKNIAPLFCLGLSVIMALQGCSSKLVERSSDTSSDSYTEVRIQVCLPNKRVYFNDLALEQLENHPLFTKYSRQQLELAPKVVRRIASSNDPRVLGDSRVIKDLGIGFGEVLIRSGEFSAGGGGIPLHGSTVANQPIYEKGYGYPAQNYVAIHVRLPEKEIEMKDRLTYWFKLPKTISPDSFTDWFNPVSMESDHTSGPSIWWKLMHRRELPIYPVSSDAPKMRVTLLRHRTLHNDPTSDSLPALTTARMKYKTTASVYEFVPKINEEIPKCD